MSILTLNQNMSFKNLGVICTKNANHLKIKKKNKCISLTHSSEVTFFTCITLLSRHKIKKALINQGFFISSSQLSLFWRKPIYFPSGMDTKRLLFRGE